jgi:2-hydroxycyclohexanecarboxyl-CoA dehydrogenase
MDLGFSNKSVVVTGGGSNIGRFIVLAFAAEGARLVIGDIDVEQAEATKALALKAGAAAVQVVKTDVAKFEDAQALMAAAGNIDVLVNNAGWERPAYLSEQTPD